jgi:hypothetical protein
MAQQGIVNELRYGLKITKLVNPIAAPPLNIFGAVAIVSSLDGSVSDGSSQTVSVGSIRGSDVDQTEADLVNILNNLNQANIASNGYFDSNPSGGMVFCLQDPSRDNFKASITLTASGPLLQIDDRNTECN